MCLQHRLDGSPSSGRLGVASVWCTRSLNEHDVGLLLGHRTMLNASGHYEDFPRAERHVLLAHLNGHPALEHEKEIVGVVVLVPDEVAFHLDDQQVMPVELPHRSWLPVFGKGRELFC